MAGVAILFAKPIQKVVHKKTELQDVLQSKVWQERIYVCYMKKHNWTAIFTLHLTDKEAAQAYTFDHHGRKVLASKMNDTDGFVNVGCYNCEEVYQAVFDKPCKATQTEER
jgi:hypothetical protein